MARRPVSKELWRQLQPLIPVFVPSAKGGARKLTVSDEAALNGILFVLQTGIPWEVYGPRKSWGNPPGWQCPGMKAIWVSENIVKCVREEH